MMIAEQIQTAIHKLDVEAGTRWLNYLVLVLVVAALAVWYDTHCYLNFSAPEAMDAAQVARNISEGHGFTTQFVRPFSLYLMQKHNQGLVAANGQPADPAAVYGYHPDLANAPLYPLMLAGLMKIHTPDWDVELHRPFWSDGGRFVRYKPEFAIAIFNQILLLIAVCLTFLVAKTVLDVTAAWLAAALMLGSDQLWRFSVSGLPTMLLLVIFLGLIWCLVACETAGHAENPNPRRRFILAAVAGLLVGLGMLTRYSFGWTILPVILFLMLFGGARRTGLALTAVLVFGITVAPWILRNMEVSGTLFGTAGYAIVEGTTPAYPGPRLMQSLSPDMTPARWINPYFVKLQANLRYFLRDDFPRLGGGWVGILFLAGLLLGLRNVVARHLRYFAIICLALFALVTAMGRTQWSVLSPELNTENLLVLLTPLVIIFGVAFFLTLLNQMEVPFPEMRFGVAGLVLILLCQQLIFTILPPKTSPSAYPPYYPPDIQKIATWTKPNELLMSDVPWAVAWYGHRQCAWTTVNCSYEFGTLNDYIKPVSGLYLTLNTLDGRLETECLQGGVDSWYNFAYKTLAFNQLPDRFPLRQFPLDSLGSGMFVADHIRW